MSDVKKILEGLTEAQKERLRRLESEMTFEKLTASFTIDDRDETGRRKGVFYSASVTRNNGEGGWTASEAMIAACVLSKHVVGMTFRDALHRGVVSKQVVSQELPGIIAAYDQSIAKIVAGEGA
jgi:hypothetical protein